MPTDELNLPSLNLLTDCEKALAEAEYFFNEDFPDGSDGPCAVTVRYREAYKLILSSLAAIKKVKP